MNMQNATGLAYKVQRKSTFKDTVSWNSIIVCAITDERVGVTINTKHTYGGEWHKPFMTQKVAHSVSNSETDILYRHTCRPMLYSGTACLESRRHISWRSRARGRCLPFDLQDHPLSRRPFGREFFIASCNGTISAGHRLTVSRRGSRRSETLLPGRQWTLDSEE